MFDGPLNPPEKKLSLVGAKPIVSTTSAIFVALSIPFFLHHHYHHIASCGREHQYSYYGHLKPSKIVPHYIHFYIEKYSQTTFKSGRSHSQMLGKFEYTLPAKF